MIILFFSILINVSLKRSLFIDAVKISSSLYFFFAMASVEDIPDAFGSLRALRLV